MDSQLQALQQEIREEVLNTRQELAAAELTRDQEKVKFLRKELLCLHEKENILLRSQASSEQCFDLLHIALPPYLLVDIMSYIIHWRSQNSSPTPEGMLPTLP